MGSIHLSHDWQEHSVFDVQVVFSSCMYQLSGHPEPLRYNVYCIFAKYSGNSPTT